jgi:hypothetical protein
LDDSRITGALQKENNLSDLSDTSEALKALGLNSDGAAYRVCQENRSAGLCSPEITIPT